MVETSLRGRPSFSTFLQSETSAGGDGLTYYDYQRFLRSQKVALLQERRANSHVPGYKKIALSKSRKVFQTKNSTPIHIISGNYAEGQPNDEYSKSEPISSTKEFVHQSTSKGSARSPAHMPSPCIQMNVVWNFDDRKYGESDRLPKITAHHRPIKSATARDRYLARPNFESEQHPPRPKTVAGDRSTGVQTNELALRGNTYYILSMHVTVVKCWSTTECMWTLVFEQHHYPLSL